MTRLRFLFVSFFAAVAGCFGLRKRLTRSDFTVEIQQFDHRGKPHLLAQICDLHSGAFTRLCTPVMPDEKIATTRLRHAVEFRIERRISDFNGTPRPPRRYRIVRESDGFMTRRCIV